MQDSRHAAYLDRSSSTFVETAGALTVVEGRCHQQPVRVALTDRSISGGSFGVDECKLLEQSFARCAVDQIPLVLALDSGGARLTAGLAGLGAFRRMYRAALDARRAGVPMVSLVERDCFGGASMLAMLCAARAALSISRIGMSGPVIVEKLAGKQDLDTSDNEAVNRLFGAPARASSGAIDLVYQADMPRRDLVATLLQRAFDSAKNISERHRQLRQRLVDAGEETRLLPVDVAAAVFRRGRPVGAGEIWHLADAVLSLAGADPLTINVDCTGQVASRKEEELVLSEYVVHLACCLRERSAAGHEVVIRICGESAGGIYVALAAGASRVEAEPQAVIRVLPAAAVEAVLSKKTSDETFADALGAGCIDRVVPARLP